MSFVSSIFVHQRFHRHQEHVSPPHCRSPNHSENLQPTPSFHHRHASRKSQNMGPGQSKNIGWWHFGVGGAEIPHKVSDRMTGDGSSCVCVCRSCSMSFLFALRCFTSLHRTYPFFIVPQNQTTGCRREIRHPDPHRPTRQGSRRRDSTHQSTHAQFDVHRHSAPRSVCWEVV